MRPKVIYCTSDVTFIFWKYPCNKIITTHGDMIFTLWYIGYIFAIYMIYIQVLGTLTYKIKLNNNSYTHTLNIGWSSCTRRTFIKAVPPKQKGNWGDCFRPDSRFVPSQWETSLQSNAVSQWLGTNLDLGLCFIMTVGIESCHGDSLLTSSYNKAVIAIAFMF